MTFWQPTISPVPIAIGIAIGKQVPIPNLKNNFGENIKNCKMKQTTKIKKTIGVVLLYNSKLEAYSFINQVKNSSGIVAIKDLILSIKSVLVSEMMLSTRCCCEC